MRLLFLIPPPGICGITMLNSELVPNSETFTFMFPDTPVVVLILYSIYAPFWAETKMHPQVKTLEISFFIGMGFHAKVKEFRCKDQQERIYVSLIFRSEERRV